MAGILLVDDDLALVELLAEYLGRHEHDVRAISDGRQVVPALEARAPDLILLDVTMPGLDGWQVLRSIRSISSVPVIMLTARSDEPDVLRGFAGGADDYVTKPFSFAQLAARVKAVLDRSTREGDDRGGILRGGDLEVDLDRHHVTRAGEAIELTPTEFRILVTLMARRGKVLSARQIVTAVWGPEYADDTGYIRRYVWHLRRKLERDPQQPAYIRNERNVGYSFRPTD